jgi:hypothetical protein
LIPGEDKKVFSSSKCPALLRPSPKDMRPLNGERDLSLEVKRTMCEADHSFLFGAKVKNECKYSLCPGQRQLYFEKQSKQFWEGNVATGIRKGLHNVKRNTSDSWSRIKLFARAPARDTPFIHSVK